MKLKIHASIPLFTSTLNLSPMANNSVCTGCHKPIWFTSLKLKKQKNTRTISIITSLNLPFGLSPYSFLLLTPLSFPLRTVTRLSRIDTKCNVDVKKWISSFLCSVFSNFPVSRHLSYVPLYQCVTSLYNLPRTTFMIYICFCLSKRLTKHQKWGYKNH